MLKGRDVPLMRIALAFVLIAVCALGALSSNKAPSAEAAGAILAFPSSTCSGATATVEYSWTPVPGALEQWLDVSLQDNDFLPGTYAPTRLEAGQRELSGAVLSRDKPHYWRVNTRTADGWVSSNVSVFVPCGPPQLLWGPTICQSADFASVHFRWAPRADAIGHQWIELSKDFELTTGVTRVGPLANSTQTYRRGGFEVGERTFFRIAWEDRSGNRAETWTASFMPACAVPSLNVTVNPELYGSSDRLVVPRLGINAPVNVRDVGYGAELGVPAGAYDVVRYNFAAYPGLQGYPGNNGVTMIGGHVDYYSVGLAVFAPLRSSQVGDIIEYRRGDGVTVRYEVDWVTDLPFNQNLTEYLRNRGSDEIILVTCNGTFDQTVRRYDLRRLVHAVRIN